MGLLKTIGGAAAGVVGAAAVAASAPVTASILAAGTVAAGALATGKIVSTVAGSVADSDDKNATKSTHQSAKK